MCSSDLEDVLLRLRPPVDLVDEQHRPEEPVPGLLDHLASVGHARGDRRQLDQVGADRVGEQVRERRLPRSGRPPQDDRGEVATLQQLGERLPGTDQMGLPDEFLEGSGPHPGGEGDVGHSGQSL